MSQQIFERNLKRNKKALKYYKNYIGYFESGYNIREITYRRYEYTRWGRRRPKPTVTISYELQDQTYNEILINVKKRLSKGRYYNRRGYKWIKKQYHTQRRMQAKNLCHYYIRGLEERFEGISPDGFKGKITWDIF